MALSKIDSSSVNGLGYGFKNRIINGGMVLNQRAAASSNAAVNGTFYVDRFASYTSTASDYLVGQNLNSITPPAGFTNYLGFQSSIATSPGAGDYHFSAQQIEGYNVSDLGWGAAGAKSITISFWVRSSLTGAFGGAVNNSSSARSYPFSYTISAANTWEQKSVTIPGDTSGTWLTTNGCGMYVRFAYGTGSSRSGAAGAWASGNYDAPTGSTAITATSGATLYITGIQLEVGTVATSFDFRSYGTELALCQRYYQRFENISGGEVTGSLSTGMAWTTTSYFAVIPYITTMRALPTGSASGSTAITLLVNGAAKQSTSITIQQYSKQSFEIAAGSSGLTAGQAGFVRFTSATDYVALSAEL